jgi:protein involved in polysaccharide export with SLBB domain
MKAKMIYKLPLFMALIALSFSSPVSAADSARKILSNDILLVRVLGEPDMMAEKKVNSDGKINYFFVGEVDVSGKTPFEVERVIRDLLDKDYLVNPQVSVEVKQYDVQYVTVTGQVGRPGRVEIPPDHQIDVIEAIGAAGDFTRIGSKKNIKLRRNRTGLTTTYSYDQLQKQAEAGAKVVLEAGDVITVSETII